MEYEHSKAINHGGKEMVTHLTGKKAKSEALNKRKRKDIELEKRSKKAGFYVHGHKNLGDVYEE